ncbi:MAG TPA: MFS transporter, partial [Candidatus Omnitrophota bacterium]|nr:MFS transporter [Candidatus Omnitrophota bacterium]
MHNIGNIFRALRNKNYRLFFCGQSVSLIGTWMQSIAISWLAYRMSNSIFVLGLVGFALQIPTFVLSPLAGIAADRHDRHRLLIVTQALSMLQALILAALVMSNVITIWQIVVLSIF